MDDRRFDRIVKSLATPRSRRAFLRRSLGAAIGSAFAITRSDTTDAAPAARGVGAICRKASDCDSGVCSPPDATGRSRCACPTGLWACGERCVDPRTAFLSDAANCGACGARCTGGKICCNGGCVAASSACGSMCCTAPRICYQSVCCLPNERSVTCAGRCGPRINNCGQPVTCDPCCTSAGQACVSNGACCSGVCVSGTCATGKSQLGGPCDETADCASGVCCAGLCTNPATFQSDLANCGACGNVCPSAAPECGQAACVSGICGGTFAPSDTLVASQTRGDCKKNICNGTGQIVSAVDDGDQPLTDNACLAASCSNGEPSFQPKAAGTECSQNGGTVCDGSGNCVVCVPNSTIPCYAGPAGTAGVGICQAGTRTCNQQGSGYGTCTGEVLPTSETTGGCNGLDDDCDGSVDDGVCPAIPHGTGGCIGSGCGILACDTGYEDCNGSFEDGCETALTSNPDHCGACDNACAASTECAAVSCVGGTCETQPVPANTPLASQTAGDCRTNVCDGQGGETTIPDDADAPANAGTGCTESVCSNGSLSTQNKTVGSSCGATGDGLCDGDGACVECLIDSDCASDVCLPDNTCCVMLDVAEFCAGQCGTVTGTCQIEECGPCCAPPNAPCGQNGDCCSGVCLDGFCAEGPRALGESCDEDPDCAEGACCGNICVAISAFDTDPLNCGSCGNVCHGDTTECAQPVCDTGICGTGYTGYGTPLADQTDGDCRTAVCDGDGGATYVADVTDAPADDGTGCTAPSCDGDTPSASPRDMGTPCDTGVCDGDGVCVECVNPEHCASGVCHEDNVCCVPDGFETTCATQCGSVFDNCDLPVECDPCCVPADDSVTCDGQCGEILNNCDELIDCGPCCVPDDDVVTCDGLCGDVLNNCDILVDCGPCGCAAGYETGSDGVTCVPTQDTCFATLDSGFTLFDADFRECNFAGAEITFKTLVRADFRGANLAGGSFIRTNLSGSNFDGANLTGVAWALAVCPDDYAIPNGSGEKCCTHLNGAVPSACT